MSISLAITSAGPIQSYDGLLLDIAKWLDREGDTVVTTMVPTFIQLAEGMFNRELRTPQMERTVTISTSAEDTPLPSDYQGMRAIYEKGSPDRALRSTSPSSVRQEFNGVAGTPEAYILVAGGIRLMPPPDTTYSFTMDYYGQIDTLSVANPTNWLLQNHADLYLAATLAFAYDYLDDDAKSQKYFNAAYGIISRINAEAQKDRYGAGPLSRLTTIQTSGGRC